MKKTASDSPYLTVKRIADVLHLKPVTIYRLVRRGQIPHINTGRKFIFDKAAVIAAMRRPITHD